MSVLWVIDDVVARRRAEVGPDFATHVRNLGHEAVEVTYDSEDVVDAGWSSSGMPVVVRGCVGFADAVEAELSARPGAFLHPRNFRLSVFAEAYGDLFLNDDYRIVSYRDFVERRESLQKSMGRSGCLFVKPAVSGKRFNGMILKPDQPLDHAHYKAFRRWSPLEDDFQVFVSRPTDIHSEHRFVVADEEVVAWSCYAINGIPSPSPLVPAEALDFARGIASFEWRPQRVFVADVAVTADGCRLIEINQFGTSGMYRCDIASVVSAVSDIATEYARVPFPPA